MKKYQEKVKKYQEKWRNMKKCVGLDMGRETWKNSPGVGEHYVDVDRIPEMASST